jgi:hypothetical protein
LSCDSHLFENIKIPAMRRLVWIARS